jgi:hypothetical protein
MSRTPDFDDLIGRDLPPAERERLKAVHELLVRAGPPPELSPEIELQPDVTHATSLDRARGRGRRVYRRSLVLAAAALAVAAVFLAGYVTGNSGSSGPKAAGIVEMKGTSAAPNALASLLVEPRDPGGNWTMRFTVEGLPKLPKGGYYVLFLTRHGKPAAPCGGFLTTSKGATVVWMNAPYDFGRFDRGGWVVTKQLPGHFKHPGPVVMVLQKKTA